MPIDPRMAAQMQALRASQTGPPTYPQQVGQGNVPTPYAAPQPVQSGLGTGGPAINTGQLPGQLSAASSGLVAGMPQANERFAQGERAGALADEMRDSSQEPVMGKMVGRIYVPASIAQHGAKLIQAYVARKKEQEQKAERSGAASDRSSLLSKWLGSLDTTTANPK